MKKLFSFVFVMFFMIWLSFWIDNQTKTNDCWYISSLRTEKIRNQALFWNKIIDKEVYNQALANLWKYCNNEANVLDTDIFVNHLMDVAFRKLDAIKGLSYGIDPDEQGKAWRDYLNNIEKDYQTPPKNIYDKFIEFRWTPEQNTWANMKTLCGKYKQVCKEVRNMYQTVTYSKTYSNISMFMIPSIFLLNCDKLADLRYNNEANIVEQIMFQNYYKIVNDTLFKSFNQIYWKEFWDLYDKFMIALWNYEYMVRRFIKVTDANTK